MHLETERLVLRPWTETDAESLYEYAKHPDVGTPAGWPAHKSVEESLPIIKNVFICPNNFAICEKENKVAIGSIALEMKGHVNYMTKEQWGNCIRRKGEEI